METSVTRAAFYGRSANVTIKNLYIEMYAIPAQMGAIGSFLFRRSIVDIVHLYLCF